MGLSSLAALLLVCAAGIFRTLLIAGLAVVVLALLGLFALAVRRAGLGVAIAIGIVLTGLAGVPLLVALLLISTALLFLLASLTIRTLLSALLASIIEGRTGL
jgi:hypothetical protein